MIENIEEENFIELTEYERKFILGNSDNGVEAKHVEEKHTETLLDTTKVPALKLFRLFKRSSLNNKSSSNSPASTSRTYTINYAERKKILTETFGTSNLFSTVLQAASALPLPKQIRTKNNRKKNLIDTILMYDSKFFEGNTEIDNVKRRNLINELVRESKTVHFSGDVLAKSVNEELKLPPIRSELGSSPALQAPATSPVPLELQLKYLKKSNSKIFSSVTKSDSNLISMTNRKSEEKKIQQNSSLPLKDVNAFNHANNKLYNKFKRTKPPSQKTKQLKVKTNASKSASVKSESSSNNPKVNLLMIQRLCF